MSALGDQLRELIEKDVREKGLCGARSQDGASSETCLRPKVCPVHETKAGAAR